MASNFGITVDKNSDGHGLKLAGDFDGTSAYELIYAIKKLPVDTLKIYVCTNGLKTINPFGLDILRKFMRSLNGQSAQIVFTGNHASQLFPGNCNPAFKGTISKITERRHHEPIIDT
jgi:hypothetical protein